MARHPQHFALRGQGVRATAVPAPSGIRGAIAILSARLRRK